MAIDLRTYMMSHPHATTAEQLATLADYAHLGLTDPGATVDTESDLRAVEEYAEEGLHSGDVPDTLVALFADLALWVDAWGAFQA